MAEWHVVAIVYFAYLLVMAFVSRRFARARWPSLMAMAGVSALAATAAAYPTVTATPTAEVVVPSCLLVIGYWVSGLYFTAPMMTLERWLLWMDDRLIGRTGILRWYRSGPRIVREYFELAYLLVYAVVPAGAVVLLLNGMTAALPRYWLIVLLSALTCYGTLPWLQTRAPRSIEAVDMRTPQASLMRRVNLVVLGRASIQANTIPSGHAATATAVGLALVSVMMWPGLVFLVLAASITIATVLGRYHYVVDSVLGVLVAVAAWAAVSVATPAS